MRIHVMIVKICICGIVVGLLGCSDPSSSTSSNTGHSTAQLLFKSGFEDGVTLTHHSSGQGSWLHGSDLGYDWDRFDHMFVYVKMGSVDRDIESSIVTERPHSGAKSLYQSQITALDGVQNRLQFYCNDDTGAIGSKVFIRRWLWYPDLESKLPDDWQEFSIAGIREGNEFTIPLDIGRGLGKENLYWTLSGFNYGAGTTWSEWTNPANGGWTVQNTVVPVPSQRWFKLETYYERHDSEGVVKVWVDDQLIFDVNRVRTKGPGTDWFAKIGDIDANMYDNTSGLPIYHYIDDIEVWDSIPF